MLGSPVINDSFGNVLESFGLWRVDMVRCSGRGETGYERSGFRRGSGSSLRDRSAGSTRLLQTSEDRLRDKHLSSHATN